MHLLKIPAHHRYSLLFTPFTTTDIHLFLLAFFLTLFLSILPSIFFSVNLQIHLKNHVFSAFLSFFLIFTFFRSHAILKPMKILITLLKPLSFLPALLMMYLIFSFSAQTGEVSGELSYKISYKIAETKSEVLHENKDSYELSYEADNIHFYVRKAAHMTEYFLLAVAVSFPLYVYRIRGIWLFFLAGIFCVGFAGLDEYHQSFVAGRGPSVRDVCIDSSGALVGIIMVQLFCWPPYMRPVLLHANVKKAAKSAADPDSATLYLIYKNLCRCSYSSFSVSACVSVSSASSRPSASLARSAILMVFFSFAGCVSLMICACASCSARFSFSRRR